MRYLFFCLFFTFSAAAMGQQKSKPQKPLDSLVKKMKVSQGFITLYSNEENTLYFALEEQLLNKDILVVTRLAQLPSGYSAYLNAGSKTAEQVIRFEKRKDNLSQTNQFHQSSGRR